MNRFVDALPSSILIPKNLIFMLVGFWKSLQMGHWLGRRLRVLLRISSEGVEMVIGNMELLISF
jgi:hypothetical protein